MKFGKKPARVDRRTLKLKKYIRQMPLLPTAIDHMTMVSQWPMDGNDAYGDCVMAAIAHQVQQWTVYSKGFADMPTGQEVIDAYLALSPNDSGLEILSTLNLWRKVGFWGHKIVAYAGLDIGHVEQAKYGIYIFGAVQLGLSLPDVGTYGPWTVLDGPPDRYKGHDVILVGYSDSKRVFYAVTWGGLVEMSYDWYAKYTDECYAILSDEWLMASGKTIDGFDRQTLLQDLADITQAVGPDPQPPKPKSWLWAILAGIVSLGILLWRLL
jgi:hypothetical protein